MQAEALGRPSRPGVGTATLLQSTRANFHRPLCGEEVHQALPGSTGRRLPRASPWGHRGSRGDGEMQVGRAKAWPPGGVGSWPPRRPPPAPNPSRTRLLQLSRPPVQRCPPHAPPDLLQGWPRAVHKSPPSSPLCPSCQGTLQTPHRHPGTWLGDRASGWSGTHIALTLATVRRRTRVPAFRGIKSSDRV